MLKRSSASAALAGLLLSLVLVAPGCVIRARGAATTGPAPVMVVDTAPPPRRVTVTPAPRAGHVWVRGHWERRGARWVWKDGHWQSARSGYTWVPGHWDNRSGRYYWVEGRWDASGGVTISRDHRTGPAPAPQPPPPPAPAPAPPEVSGGVYVEVAPPPPRQENPAPRAGFVWQQGRWMRTGNRWKWQAGKWVPVRTGKRWVPGHWEQRGSRHYWVEGRWEVVQSRDHRGGPKPGRSKPRRKVYR